MEQRYQDMLQAALASFLAAHQTQAALVQAQTVPPLALVGAQPEPVQLSAEAKHLRDFRKYMKCLEDQKVQCAVFFLEDRGTTWWETAERMLGRDVSKITWEQFKESFYAKLFSANYDAEFDMLSRFAPDIVKDEEAKTKKFVRDLSLHERADSSKAADRGSALGQKRKVELQPDLTPQRNLRSGGVFQKHRRELAAAKIFEAKVMQ
ncbi:gag-protease polyprotein [Cucumis melo var. makuwa]|uniref:Gag-protease polyprotein n=1 Tax=Cucumis melo var. makuwa TaxID=1194695 RepID=A0A5D3DSY6_CUCMM|nr:gag-protease polyprotein [Cucumis melo var. makuwa]